jgi:hypothetical protein
LTSRRSDPARLARCAGAGRRAGTVGRPDGEEREIRATHHADCQAPARDHHRAPGAPRVLATGSGLPRGRRATSGPRSSARGPGVRRVLTAFEPEHHGWHASFRFWYCQVS